MTDHFFWPWGLLIMLLLAFLIGWLIRDILMRRSLEEKERIIGAQEREFIKLAQKHVESRKAEKQEKAAFSLPRQTGLPGEITRSQILSDKPDIPGGKIEQLQKEIDRLTIENQKLATVPQALYIEKNKMQKKEIKKLRKALSKLRKKYEKVQARLEKCEKENKKSPPSSTSVREVVIRETIDFKKLKKMIARLPVKKTKSVRIVPDKKNKT